MEYFITGATGFVGGHVATQLLDEGHDLIVLARNPERARELEAAGAMVREGDITEKETLREPMEGVDGVFHIAGWYDIGGGDAALGERINVDGTRNVLQMMDELDISKGVYTSTLTINSDTGGQVVDEEYTYEGPHLTAYDRTKWKAHYEVAKPMMEAGLPLVIVMPALVYGPNDTSVFGQALRNYLQGELPAIPREVAYSPGHVEDIATAHISAMDRGRAGEEYIIGGEPVTLVEMFEIVADITGMDPPRALPPVLFGALAPVARIFQEVLTLPAEYRAETLRTLAGVTYIGDNSKATAELGLEHRPLRAGLQETIAYEQARLSE